MSRWVGKVQWRAVVYRKDIRHLHQESIGQKTGSHRELIQIDKHVESGNWNTKPYPCFVTRSSGPSQRKFADVYIKNNKPLKEWV